MKFIALLSPEGLQGSNHGMQPPAFGAQGSDHK
jgi:hypothetical protein